MATLETGAGSSTIVFAAAGAEHEVVTPDPAEEERIRAACERLGISSERVTFRIGPSHEVLPALAARPLDLALVDGAHGFPYPILDWWAIAPQLKVGGTLLLDDAYMPPVLSLLDALRASDDWEVTTPISYRTAVVRKRGEGLLPFDWEGDRVGGAMSFRYLPPPQRAVAAFRHRVFSTRAGLALVGLARRREGLRWRKTG
jgi:predicted O-methyltransferase YrrM